MANEQNLIPFNKRTESEQRENAKKGGKRSGEVRRQRKAMREQMELLLSLPCNITDKKGNKLASQLSELLGIDESQIDNQMILIASLWKTAINGNSLQQIQAVKEIREIVCDSNTVTDDDRLQIINDLPTGDDDDENKN